MCTLPCCLGLRPSSGQRLKRALHKSHQIQFCLHSHIHIFWKLFPPPRDIHLNTDEQPVRFPKKITGMASSISRTGMDHASPASRHVAWHEGPCLLQEGRPGGGRQVALNHGADDGQGGAGAAVRSLSHSRQLHQRLQRASEPFACCTARPADACAATHCTPTLPSRMQAWTLRLDL